MNLSVVGLGEALFDRFSPQRVVLGGAPLNLAVHAHQLLRERGEGIVASSVGNDLLGVQLLDDLRGRGMTTRFLSRSSIYPTSTVDVKMLPNGDTCYDIVSDVAWDHLDFSDELAMLAATCSAVCFGTLAQRSPKSRETIQRFLGAADSALKVCDVNLRQNYYSDDILRESLSAASVVKLNEVELPKIRDLLSLPSRQRIDDQVFGLLHQFELTVLALTRGEDGTVLYSEGERIEATVPHYSRAANADPVGAGDSCCAAIIVGLLLEKPLSEITHLANRVGAFVASQQGATPTLPAEILESV